MDREQATIDSIYSPILEQLTLVEKELQALAPSSHPVMGEFLAHLFSNSGKLMRPAITLLASRFHPNDGKLPVTMATAVELLHLASLVHDDTVDHAPVRRGVATVSSLWGRDVAVQVGDFVFATSAVFVCNTCNVRVIRRFSETIRDLAVGQLMESSGTFRCDHTREQYQERIYNKTASLFSTAAESGAILSGAPEATVQAMKKYGRDLGMAFQIVDDILDFEGTEEEVGKPVGHDLLEGVLTLPAMLLLERYPEDNPIVPLFQGQDPEGNLQKAVAMIRDSKVLDDACAVARGFCVEAGRALQDLPDTTERQSLLNLLEYVTNRRM